MPEILRILREVAPDIEVTILSQLSPELALSLMRGRADVALIRREKEAAGLNFKPLLAEPVLVAVPNGHRLAGEKAIAPVELTREILICPSRAAPVLRTAIDDWAKGIGMAMKYSYDADNISAGASLVAATDGLFLLPRYDKALLPAGIVAKPLRAKGQQWSW